MFASWYALFLAWLPQLEPTVALAAVAVIGYLLGRRQSRHDAPTLGTKTRLEIKRALAIVRELERNSDLIRRHLERYESTVRGFRQRVNSLSPQPNETAWRQLSKEAEELLRPTLNLATQIARAYDEIRQQGNQLMTFTEVRTDPLTGISNRRALDESLFSQFAMIQRYQQKCSLLLLDIDFFKQINDSQGHLAGDHVLQHLARLLDDSARETDLVARFGGEEFVVLLPQTDLAGAGVFGDRLRQRIEDEMEITISCGLAEARAGETPACLIDRADMALYHAKQAGRNRVSVHNGTEVEPLEPMVQPPLSVQPA